MKVPEVEVIRFNGFDVMTDNSNCDGFCSGVECGTVCPSDSGCPEHTGSCTAFCGAVQGYCTQCVDDCYGID